MKKITILFLLIISMVQAQNTVNRFNSNQPEINLVFPGNTEYYIDVPQGKISEARMRITGLDIQGHFAVPADVFMVMDVSGSMNDDCPGGDADPGETPCKINDAKTAAHSFLDNIDFSIIKVGLAHYSYWEIPPGTDIDEPLTNDKTGLDSMINTYWAEGWTNMGGGMQLAINELLSRGTADPDRRFMILLTDGRANCAPDGDNYNLGIYGPGRCGVYTRGKNYALAMADYAYANNVIIHSIAFGSDADTDTLQTIADRTGGIYYFAPTASELIAIYNTIAKEISYENTPTPSINSLTPMSISDAWSSSQPFKEDVTWSNDDCGTTVTCMDYRTFIQSNLDNCGDPCRIDFSVDSSTEGQLNLSDLYIEINEPPSGNYPPLENCRQENLVCGETELIIDIDDGVMVTDANDPLDSLIWTFKNSSGAGFSFNNDFNLIRLFRLSVTNPDNPANELFFFNVADPWGESTYACLDVNYEGCMGLCGNGNLDPGEECDDGCLFGNPNICEPIDNGDGCSMFCQVESEFCGNGNLDPGEYCDDGNFILCDGCVNDCSRFDNICGDSIIECGEICELGETRPCTIAGEPGFELCLGCTGFSKCVPSLWCGDGVLAPPEICDDSNNLACDGCHPTCTRLDDVCGDSIKECGETCELGETRACSVGGEPGFETCIDCSGFSSCTPISFCGDGNIVPPEVCDDSNNLACDGCHPTCTRLDDVCGDSITECGEVCDNDERPCTIDGQSGSEICLDDCSGYSACTPIVVCGDWITDLPEMCDDGNNEPCDGCSDDCSRLDDVCGDDIKECTETCELGETRACIIDGEPGFETCLNDCSGYDSCFPAAWCGDGVTVLPEVCDDSGNEPCDGCDPTCARLDDVCGDSIRECGEVCELGDVRACIVAGDLGFETCLDCTGYDSCVPATLCGDGNLVPPEVCDDGNNEACDGCHPTCTRLDDVCGDGIRECSEICEIGDTLSCLTVEGEVGERTCLGDCSGYDDCTPIESNNIKCDLITPNYLLHEDTVLTIDLNEIYNFNGITPTGVVFSDPDITINPNLPFNIDVVTTGFNSEKTVILRVQSSDGYKECPLNLLNLDSQCDKQSCDSCFDLPIDQQYLCLRDDNCLDTSILVHNPFASFRPNLRINTIGMPDYTISMFSLLPDFVIDHPSGPSNDIFIIDGSTLIHNTRSATIMNLNFYGYSGESRYCPELVRTDFDIGEETFDADTDLLVSNSRAITGYYNIGGSLFGKGPFIFTAKVWLRK